MATTGNPHDEASDLSDGAAPTTPSPLTDERATEPPAKPHLQQVGTTHQITNDGETRSTHYVVELLGPSAAATAQPVVHNGRVRVEQHDPAPPSVSS